MTDPDADTYRSMTKQHLAEAKRRTGGPWILRWLGFLLSQLAISVPMLIAAFWIACFVAFIVWIAIQGFGEIFAG
jgi:hypothetical protein